MPAHLRAFIVIVILSSLVFLYLNFVARNTIGIAKFRYLRNSWFVITSIAFLAHNYWVYLAISWIYLFFTSKREPNKVAIFFILLFAAPEAGLNISGFGMINYLFTIDHQRFLVIVLLFPLFLRLVFNKTSQSRYNILDRILFTYLLLTIILHFRDTTITNTLRFAFYQCIDVYVPYYVVSRSLTNMVEFKKAIFGYVAATMLLSIIGLFEMLRHWHLYTSLASELGLSSGLSVYLQRDGMLRASASISRIPLGYVIAIGFGLYLWLQNDISSKIIKYPGYLLLTLGLISPLSRGPWVGFVVLITTYITLGKQKLRNIFLLSIFAGTLILIVASSSFAPKIFDLIPFIGNTEISNITYRQRLIENSMIVIKRNPWFGSIDYIGTPEMIELRQGQGIIDIVNTYIQIALEYGLVGLSLFLAFFAVTCWKVYKNHKASLAGENQYSRLGRALLSTMICIMLIIFTVSSVSAIPIMYWTMAAMCAAYVSMTNKDIIKHSNAHLTP